MKQIFAVAFLPLAFGSAQFAVADTFGSGANTFAIEFATIGNPNNGADTSGNPNPAGSVPYSFQMGKFEISERMIESANALGGLAITKTARGPDKPATDVSWYEAARFVNWLNTSTGFMPAYKFAVQPGDVGYNANASAVLWSPGDAGYNSSNPLRNSLARYVLPTVDEWYKAAFYDPVNAVYYDYPTGSDTRPTAVTGGTVAGTAVFGQSFSQGPADIMNAGGLSPYGTMAQGGNVWEWEETEFDLVNDLATSARGLRGGHWNSASGDWPASLRSIDNPQNSDSNNGFRVVSVPEPSGSIALTFVITMAFIRRQLFAPFRNRLVRPLSR